MRRPLVAVCALALVLAGCSQGGPESAGPKPSLKTAIASSPSAQRTASDSEACTLLSKTDRRSIAGDSLRVAPVTEVKGASQCKWVNSFSAATRVLYVLTSPAQVWAKNVSPQVDQLIRTGRVGKDMLDRLQAAKKKVARGLDKLSGDEACGMFELLAEANGHKKGTTEMVAFPPLGTQFSANARTCSKGIYTTVTYTEPTLKPSPPAAQAVLRLMKIAQIRAIKFKKS